MAEEVTKTIENVDRLFARIVVNGEVHESQNYVPQDSTDSVIAPQIIEEDNQSDTQEPIAQPTQDVGEDVYAVVLNDTKHDFVDPETVQNLSQEVVARQNMDNQLQQGINGLTGDVADLGNDIDSIKDKIPNQASAQNQLADKDFVGTSISDAVSALDASSVGGNNKYIKSISEADGVISATEGSIDTAVTEGSNNPVTSDAVHDAIQESMGDSIKTYPTMTDLEQDLPNLDEGQIVATEEGDAFTTVDIVQSGVFNPVTSNAVARAFGDWQLVYDLSTDSTHLFQVFGLALGSHKILWFHVENIMVNTSFTQGSVIGTLPQGWRPTLSSGGTYERTMIHCAYNNERRPFSIEVSTDGKMLGYVFGSPMSGAITIAGLWGDAYLFIS